jgi:hypothetical protein
MIRAHLALPIALALLCSAAAAAADEPAPKRPTAAERPHRRVEKHDQARSAQEKKSHVHVIDIVTIVGRGQRPMAVFDLNMKTFRFPVGTARYSPRDQRYVPAKKERW